MKSATLMRVAALCLLGSLTARPTAAKQDAVIAGDYSKLPANTWVLIHSEDNSGGKAFARLVIADNIDRLYLWGTGGKKPARNVFLRYELESLAPPAPRWLPAFPESMRGKWTAEKFPPFRIYGQTGPDGLKYDEGPRLQVVGGYNHTNRIRWWDFDGIKRPSPIHTFNMACWDALSTTATAARSLWSRLRTHGPIWKPRTTLRLAEQLPGPACATILLTIRFCCSADTTRPRLSMTHGSSTAAQAGGSSVCLSSLRRPCSPPLRPSFRAAARSSSAETMRVKSSFTTRQAARPIKRPGFTIRRKMPGRRSTQTSDLQAIVGLRPQAHSGTAWFSWWPSDPSGERMPFGTMPQPRPSNCPVPSPAP